jgi:hypothetical protein
MDQAVVEQAEEYRERHDIGMSRLVEKLLSRHLAGEDSKDPFG